MRADMATTYRVNINVLIETADETTLIYDLIKDNMKAQIPRHDVRLEDERYAVDVDNNHDAACYNLADPAHEQTTEPRCGWLSKN